MKWLPSVMEDVPLHSELVARVGWFISLRWMAAAGILAGGAIALIARQSAEPIFAVGVAVLAYNVLLARAHRGLADGIQVSAVQWRLFAHSQILLDWASLAVLSALTGGLESPLLLFFIFHVILAAMLLPRRECLIQTTLGLFLIVAMAHYGMPGGLLHLAGNPFAVMRVYGDDTHVLGYIVTVGGTLYICAFLASAIAERLRVREREIIDAKNREERMHAEMALLHELAKSVNATLDLDQVLQRVVEQATRVTQARACTIRLLTESGDLPMFASHGLSQAYLRKGRVDLNRSPVDRKVLSGQPVLIDDVSTEHLFQYPEELAREGIRSLLSLPLITAEGPLGVIRIYGDVPRAFDEADVRFMQHFASLATIAIANARTCLAIQASERERSRFTRTVAHELRSPLATIMGNLRIILQGYTGPVPDKAAQLLERAHQRGNLLLALVSDLLALVSGQEAAARQAWDRLALADVVRQVISDLAPQAEAKSLHVELAVGDPNIEVLGDRQQLLRLVENLVSNAVKYTPDGGRIGVRLAVEERWVEMVVEDTGIGIPAEAQERIFEEFFRAENARHLTENGTGLGLAIARRIVEAHHGRIALQSEENRFTRVTVLFPCKAGPGAPPPVDPAGVCPAAKEPAAGSVPV